MTASASDVATEERTLVITRTFNAPRELVFKMWTNPEHLVHWMGPVEYPAMKVDNDFRVGGKWRIGLHAVDGSEDLWQSGVYREIAPPRRLAFTWAWEENGARGHETVVELDFVPAGRNTRLVLNHRRFDGAESRDKHSHGWSSSFNCLDQFLQGG